MFPNKTHYRNRIRFLSGTALLALVCGVSIPAQAATYTVTSNTDDGTGSVSGTLSWAITQANGSTGNSIVIDSSVTTITVTGTLPDLTQAVKLTASGVQISGSTLSGNGNWQLTSGSSLGGASGAAGADFQYWGSPVSDSGQQAVSGTGFVLTNNGTLSGGDGGRGANNTASNTAFAGGPPGGVGGDGATAVSGTNFTLTNRGTIAGGNGGNGGNAAGGTASAGDGGDAGNGATGVSGSGFTLTNSGTITGGSGGAGGLGGSVPNTGAAGVNGTYAVGVESTGNSTVYNSGSIAGGGAADAIAFSGGGNKLVIQAGGTFTGNVVSTSGTTNGGDTLTLGGDTNASGGNTFDLTNIGGAAAFQGFNGFSKEGNSAWTLTGTGAMDWSVVSGRLLVNGSVGAVTVSSGGTIGGTGTIGTTIVNSGGTLSPGTTLGTLNVAGDLTLSSGSTYSLDVSGTSSDFVDVTGQATVTGSRLTITTLDRTISYRSGQTYTILNAAGGVTGTFNAPTFSNSAFLAATLDYSSGTQVDLTIGLNSAAATAFASVANTSNGYATAHALDGITQSGSSLALYNSILVLNAEQARTAFSQLSGEQYASNRSAFTQGGMLLGDVINDRMRAAADSVGMSTASVTAYGEEPKNPATRKAEQAMDAVMGRRFDPGRFAAWGKAFGAWTNQQGNGDMAGTASSTGGFLLGADGFVTENWRLGLMAGYSNTSFRSSDGSSRGMSDNYHFGIYGGTQRDNLSFRSGISYTWHDINGSRNVDFTGFSDHLTSNYNGSTLQSFGEFGYRIDTGVASFEPFVNLANIDLRTERFTESGGSSALTVSSQATNTTFTTLGMRSSTDFDMGTTIATARTTLGWRHAYGDVAPNSTQALAGSEAFTVTGRPIAEDAALVEAGIDFLLSPRTTLGLTYQGQFAKDETQNRVETKLRVQF